MKENQLYVSSGGACHRAEGVGGEMIIGILPHSSDFVKCSFDHKDTVFKKFRRVIPFYDQFARQNVTKK